MSLNPKVSAYNPETYDMQQEQYADRHDSLEVYRMKFRRDNC
jgi:hypothetical protein